MATWLDAINPWELPGGLQPGDCPWHELLLAPRPFDAGRNCWEELGGSRGTQGMVRDGTVTKARVSQQNQWKTSRKPVENHGKPSQLRVDRFMTEGAPSGWLGDGLGDGWSEGRLGSETCHFSYLCSATCAGGHGLHVG